MSFFSNIMLGVVTICISTSIYAAAEASKSVAQKTSGQDTQAMQTSKVESGAIKETTNQQDKVNINTASLQDLMEVKGMNRLKAKNVVRYRNQHLFKSLDELSSVKGFKRMNQDQLKTIQEQMSIH